MTGPPNNVSNSKRLSSGNPLVLASLYAGQELASAKRGTSPVCAISRNFRNFSMTNSC